MSMYCTPQNCCLSQTFTELLKPHMNEAEMLAMVSKSEEFEQVKVSVS